MNGKVKLGYETIAVSTRIRLARNFADYPFPGRLLRDAHAEEQAGEMIQRVAEELGRIEDFHLYKMSTLSDERAAVLKERNLISRDLLSHRRISAALVSGDESISVMLNEEDHIREQYFRKGFDLKNAYERLEGIDDAIAAYMPFAYDEEFGYLTACPTNLGTGLRASVMLFLPAVSRRQVMRSIAPLLTRKGIAVRGSSGEGSGTEGELFQISNEVTLGYSEAEILGEVEQAVSTVAEVELRERERMKAEGGVALEDSVMRSLGVLTHCRKLDLHEFMARAADVKLGLSLGMFEESGSDRTGKLFGEIDDLAVAMRPANLNLLSGAPLETEEQEVLRAEFVRKTFRGMHLPL